MASHHGCTEDHGVSEAVYFEDPDGNGVEIYYDRDRSLWPRDANGDVAMTSREFEVGDLLKELAKESVDAQTA